MPVLQQERETGKGKRATMRYELQRRGHSLFASLSNRLPPFVLAAYITNMPAPMVAPTPMLVSEAHPRMRLRCGASRGRDEGGGGEEPELVVADTEASPAAAAELITEPLPPKPFSEPPTPNLPSSRD